MNAMTKGLIVSVAAGAMALASATPAAAHDRHDYAGRSGWGERYGDDAYRGNARAAVAQCVAVAERNADRHSHGRADVTDVRSVRETRRGYEVRGRIAVNGMARDWRSGEGNYGRGWNDGYRGWNGAPRGYDSGSFTCRIDRGRVVDLDYSGIRGL